LSATASGFCGFFHSLPLLGALPTQQSLAAAVRGIASEQNLHGFGTASWIDLLVGRLWQAGGASLLATAQWLTAFAGWTLAAAAAFAVVLLVLRSLNDARTARILFGSAILLLLMTCVPPLLEAVSIRRHRTSDLRLVLPVELANRARALNGAKIFANPSALAHLVLLAPDLAGSVSMADSARLATEPARWREAFRETRWNALLLSGAVSEYRPLLEHLMNSPDFHLAAVTNHGFLFRYGVDLPTRSLDESFRLDTDHTTALYLAQISTYYDAIRRTAEARASIERALELAPDDPIVLSHAATFAAAHKRWQEAIDYSKEALARDDRLLQAKLVQALALLETGEPTKAEELLDQVLLQSPDDPYSLFLSARVRRSLRDYAKEAESLERIIAIARKAGLSTANYQIYLGQAYARQSLADAALQNYRAALKSGQLDARQVEEVQDAINSLETRRP
jgi:tetratricopeptide (TPR) repeat protein